MANTDESKIEYEPHDPPTLERDGYDVYVYAPEGRPGLVPDVIITRSEGDEQFDLWGFQGEGGVLIHTIRTIHRHPPDYPDGECEKWSIHDDEFPALSDGPESPEEVTDIAVSIADAPLLDKSRPSEDADDA